MIPCPLCGRVLRSRASMGGHWVQHHRLPSCDWRDDSWRDQAACRDKPKDAFFPVDGSPNYAGDLRAARRVCASCPVAEPCLRYALEQGIDHGVWGGLSVRQRREIRARR